MYRNKGGEITRLITETVIANILSRAVGTLGIVAGSIASVGADGIKFAYDVYRLNQQINTNNDNVAAIFSNVLCYKGCKWKRLKNKAVAPFAATD